MNKVLTTILFLGMVVSISAMDHVMQATKAVDSRETKVDSQLSLSLKEAQDYAVQQNRTLRNASLAVQEAYASRWQTIASMLPQVDASYGYSDMFDFQLDFGGIPMAMANTGTLNITASVGLNGQAVVGVLLNNIAIDMKKIAFEQNEIELRGNVISAYVTELAAVTSTGYRVIFGGEYYNILSIDPMNYQKKTLRFTCRREKRQS